MKEAIPFIGAPDQLEHWLDCLRRAMPDEHVIPFAELNDQELERCTVAIVANPEPEALAKLANLRWVQSVWAGVERLIAQTDPATFKIVRMVDPHLAATMAEAVLTWTLYLHRNIAQYAAQQRQQCWLAQPYVEPHARTVSVMGLGEMGLASTALLRTLGFKVQGWSRQPKDLPGITCFSGREGLQQMLKTTNVLICLLPLTPQTSGLIDAKHLALLPDGAAVINFGRGPIFEELALKNALDSGQLMHAVLDVFNLEPLPPAQWQWRHPSVSVLPHCAAITSTVTAAQIVARNMRQYRLTGQTPAGISFELGY